MASFDLFAHTHLLVVAGSRAYGLNRPDSDVDLRGVAVPPAAFLHGFLRRFEQEDDPEALGVFRSVLTQVEAGAAPEKVEGSVYDLIKFIRLASDANPNMLDVLFGRDEEVRVQTAVGRRLREERGRFLSKRVAKTYAGYARGQLKRIQGHRAWLVNPPSHEPTRAEYGLPEHALLPRDQLVAAENAAAKGVVAFDPSVVAVLQRERKYHSARRQWDQYQTWKKHRNPGRAKLEVDHGYDTKHAMHLVRLLRMGLEILQTGQVHVWRGAIDRQELLEIRSGAWEFDQLIEWADRQSEALRSAQGTSSLPDEADKDGLDALCIQLVEEALGQTR
ncbi:MAG: nucleotidyltransferase domain-containing protein [Myxococcota bacterium]